MKLKNYLVDLLSNIIHDKLQLLSETKNDMKKTEEFKKVEELFSDVNNIVNVDDEFLRSTLSLITDSDTVDGIVSNVDMIKIVLNGKNNGLDLSLDDSQEELIKSVHSMVNNFRTELESKNKETKDYLEDFISKCRSLSSEIGTGVVRDIDTLDEIFASNDVSIDDIIKSKYEILRNNNKNYNLNLEGNVKEEVELKISLKKINFELDDYSDIERGLLVSRYSSSFNDVIDFISSNDIKLSAFQLLIVLALSDLSIVSNLFELCKSYEMDFNDLFIIPGVFVSKDIDVNGIIDQYRSDNDFYVIENLSYINPCYELFVDNISVLDANNRSVSDCFKHNILSLIVPDLSKNVTILSKVELSSKEFSIIVINPFLATSISGFEECGLGDYVKCNPIRLTTSYYRLKSIASNIVLARKNGQAVFRSLNDKKTYWLNKNITHDEVK